MNSFSRKRVPLDVTALSSEDWGMLADLINRAKRDGGPATLNVEGYEEQRNFGTSNLTRLARQIKGSRNQRDRFFDANLFGEPAWDILLTLFIADTEGYRMSVSEVIDASNVPSTTALRWIGRMIDTDIVFRYPSRTDKRTIYVSLTKAGFARMSSLLDTIGDRVNSA